MAESGCRHAELRRPKVTPPGSHTSFITTGVLTMLTMGRCFQGRRCSAHMSAWTNGQNSSSRDEMKVANVNRCSFPPTFVFSCGQIWLLLRNPWKAPFPQTGVLSTDFISSGSEPEKNCLGHLQPDDWGISVSNLEADRPSAEAWCRADVSRHFIRLHQTLAHEALEHFQPF